MSADLTGRVSPAETQEVIANLHGLYARAAEHDQTWLAMAFSLAAESLADNIETMDAFNDDDAAH